MQLLKKLFSNIKQNVYKTKLKNKNENLARSSTKHLLLLQIKKTKKNKINVKSQLI